MSITSTKPSSSVGAVGRTASLASALALSVLLSSSARAQSGSLPVVEFQAASQTAVEADGTLAVTIELDITSATDVIVPFSLSGTAQDGSDFTIDASPATVLAGSLTQDIQVQLTPDVLYEAAETLVLSIGTPVGADLGSQLDHTITINDDDVAPEARFQVRRQQALENSGVVPVTVVLTEASGVDASFAFAFGGTADGPASLTPDFTAPAGPLFSVPAGQLSADLDITLLDDAMAESTEYIVITLSSPVDATLATGGAVHGLVILDQDGVGNTSTRGLELDVATLDFGLLRTGETSASSTVVVRNQNNVPVTFKRAKREGDDRLDITISYADPIPHVLQPGETTSFDVSYSPSIEGELDAWLEIKQTPPGLPATLLPLEGLVIGSLGQELHINVGQRDYTDNVGQVWIADYGRVGDSVPHAQVGNVQQTLNDPLYAEARSGDSFGYELQVPSGGYNLWLHFCEPVWTGVGARIFDVAVEGVTEVNNLDLVVAAGHMIAYAVSLDVIVADGVLDIDLTGVNGQAILSGIELRAIEMTSISPTLVDFNTVEQGQFDSASVTLANDGALAGVVDTLTIEPTTGSALDFRIELDGTTYFGSTNQTVHSVNLPLPASSSFPMTLTFEPTVHQSHYVEFEFAGSFGTRRVDAIATGGANAGWGFLHPVIFSTPDFIVDYDGDGLELSTLQGDTSHTHEAGRLITAWEWSEGGQAFSTDANTSRVFAVGDTGIELEIWDNNVPAQTAVESSHVVTVHDRNHVPGILTSYFVAGPADPSDLLNNVPLTADFVERRTGLTLAVEDGSVGGSSITGDVMVRQQANFEVTTAATYDFTVSGGSDSYLEVDGQSLFESGTLSVVLAAGTYALDLQFAVDVLADLPCSLTVAVGGVQDPAFADQLEYDASSLPPVLHDMETVGSSLGGNYITIQGFGFYPADQVTVHWGDVDFTQNGTTYSFETWDAGQIQLYSPPGTVALGGPSTGQIDVSVETPAGTTDVFPFVYEVDGPVAISFIVDNGKFVTVPSATCGEWGPDGRFWVGTTTGEIYAIEFDEDYNEVSTSSYLGVSSLVNNDICGITFSPFDGTALKLYVSHSQHYQHGSNPPVSASDYTGEVSLLEGPFFDISQAPSATIITSLPVSNHDHGVNGLEFDNNGDLLICTGGNTNAGVEHPWMGGLPESPLSGAILRARLSDPSFDGAVSYVLRSDGITPNDDQRDGHDVVLDSGDIEVFAPGMRNPFDLVLTTWGYWYATDNSPNSGYGFESTGQTTDSGIHADSSTDEVLLLEQGHYYGHPNRARSPEDPRQAIYRNESEPSAGSAFTQRIGSVNSSTDGIAEYRAQTFNGAMRGNLLAQQFGNRTRRIVMQPDNRDVQATYTNLPLVSGLGVNTGPGGAFLVVDYNGAKVKPVLPNDAAAIGLTVHDIHPWRGVAGTPFVIGGEDFGTLSNTTVTIDGISATLTSVSAKRIEGVIPANPANPFEPVHILVTVGLQNQSLLDAFTYLSAPGTRDGFWVTGSAVPDSIGEVACGIVDGQMFMVGEGSSKTYSYDISEDVWDDSLAARPFAGNHHGCEVIGTDMYLIGGLGGGAGRLQIYDTVSDSWSLGQDMPWNAGSVSTALINGRIYAAGGIVGSSTVRNTAVYDPMLDQWTTLAQMPDATKVNHAAAATDGSKLWIFGGRGGANVPQPGYDVVQVYDPVTDTWETSNDVGTALMPLPDGRGGTGRSVFYEGEFYVFGGETSNSDPNPLATPDKVFPQVYAYNVTTNTWREENDMVTPRHGIYPVAYFGRILIAAGGTDNGFSQSDILEIWQK